MKNFKFKDYKPLNYGTWVLGNRARKGVNIKKLRLLNKSELRIWNAAIPYQDQRDDPGQGEIVTYFVMEFIKYFSGDRRVAVPAGILHDIGFYGCNAKAWKRLVKSSVDQGAKEILKSTDTEEQRRPHQNRGNLIAGRLLEKVGWPKKYNHEIADIIGDHDTRKLPASKNGKIVRAADFLWRVSYPHMQIYYKDRSVNEILEITEEIALYQKHPYNLRNIELKIAKIEMVNTLFFKFGNKAKEILKLKYKKELDKIVEFYSKFPNQ